MWLSFFVFLIRVRPPRSIRTVTLFPYPTLFRSLEQLRRLAVAELAEQVPGDARLAALVVLVGAIDVEELEARPLRRCPRPIRGRLLGDPPRHPAVEEVLAPAVAVQRAQPREVLAVRIVVEARRAIAVGRRRGGVDQRDLLLRAVVPEYLGQAKVVGEQRVAVALRGGRDGAEVEDGGEPPFGPAQELRQLLRRDHVLDLVVGEVAPLVALAQAVADDHRLAALAEGGDEIGADEAGAAGDEKHGRGESLVIWRSVKKRLLIEARRKPPQPRPLPGLQGSTGRRTRLMCAPPAAILSMGRSAPRRRKDEKCRARARSSTTWRSWRAARSALPPACARRSRRAFASSSSACSPRWTWCRARSSTPWPRSPRRRARARKRRSEEHTSELQSLMRISYAVFCLEKKT